MTNFIKSVLGRNDRIINASKLWQLSVGDIEFKAREDIICSLGSFNSKQTICEKHLRNWWQITDRNSMVSTLAWLEQQGHSAVYNKTNNRSAGFELNFHLKHRDFLKDRSLTAWDLGRFCSLTRLGQFAGLISEEEYWLWMEHVAPRLQSTYKSWKEFSQHYLLGRKFALRSEPDQNTLLAVKFLLKNRYSPWKLVKWKTDLDEKSNVPWISDNPFYINMSFTQADKDAGQREYFEKMVAHDGNNPSLLSAYAVFLEKHLQHYPDACKYYDRAIQSGANFEIPFLNLLNLLIQNNEQTSSIKKLLDKWINRFPESADAHYQYADWLFDSKDENYTLIDKHYRRAIEIEPEQEWHYESYGEFLAIARSDYDKAKRMFEKALEIKPDFEAAFENLERAEEALSNRVH